MMFASFSIYILDLFFSRVVDLLLIPRSSFYIREISPLSVTENANSFLCFVVCLLTLLMIFDLAELKRNLQS